MADVTVLVAARTDVGRVRTNNEDALVIMDLTRRTRVSGSSSAEAFELGDRGLLLALSDGMGGHQAGEVASARVLEELCDALGTANDTPMLATLDTVVRKANRAVFRAAVDSHKKGMGATLTALLVRDTEAHLAQVGDSRAYLLRSGRIVQLSRDQSMVQLLLEAGAISPEEAKNSPRKNLILQAMGFAEDVKVAIGRLDLRRDDVFLLCCDGLSNALSSEELRDALASGGPGDVCERLINLANERGGEDNLTAVVARFSGSTLEAAGPEAPALEVLQDQTRAESAALGGQPQTAERSSPAALPQTRTSTSVRASDPGGEEASPARLLLVAALLLIVLGALVLWLR